MRTLTCSPAFAQRLTPLEHIFATLCEYGRLTLVQLATHAEAPYRRIRYCLSSLLERQLVLHYTADADTPTYYAVNFRAIYNLARGDNIVTLVTDRYGEGAGRIVNNIQHLGLTRMGDLASAYEFENSSKRDSGTGFSNNHTDENGTDIGDSVPSGTALPDVATVGSFHATMRTLLQSGILIKVGVRACMPSYDLQDEIEETVIGEQFPDRKITGPKKQAEFDKAVNDLKRKWRADDEFSDANDLGSKGTLRRPGQILDPPSKRIKVSNGHANGVSHDQADVFEDTGLRLSVLWRCPHSEVLLLTLKTDRPGSSCGLCSLRTRTAKSQTRSSG